MTFCLKGSIFICFSFQFLFNVCWQLFWYIIIFFISWRDQGISLYIKIWICWTSQKYILYEYECQSIKHIIYWKKNCHKCHLLILIYIVYDREMGFYKLYRIIIIDWKLFTWLTSPKYIMYNFIEKIRTKLASVIFNLKIKWKLELN